MNIDSDSEDSTLSSGQIYAQANEPFDHPSADFILRTSDDVEFHVHRSILCMASSFFTTLLSSEYEEETMCVPESSQVMDSLLRYCYPVRYPTFEDVPFLGQVLVAATTYRFKVAYELLREALHILVHKQPLQVYALASRLGLEQEAALAAEACQQSLVFNDASLDSFDETLPGVCWVPEMANITAGAYYRLLQFVRGAEQTSFCVPKGLTGSSLYNHSFKYEDADVVFRSREGEQFRAHTLVINLAGPESTLLDTALDTEEYTDDGLPVVQLDEKFGVVEMLLEMCYPMPSSIINIVDYWETANVLRAAMDYKLEKVVRFIRKSLERNYETNPLMVYFIAKEHKWEVLADRCAGSMVANRDGRLEELYDTEMEQVKANVYHRLLRFAWDTGMNPAVSIDDDTSSWDNYESRLIRG